MFRFSFLFINNKLWDFYFYFVYFLGWYLRLHKQSLFWWQMFFLQSFLSRINSHIKLPKRCLVSVMMWNANQKWRHTIFSTRYFFLVRDTTKLPVFNISFNRLPVMISTRNFYQAFTKVFSTRKYFLEKFDFLSELPL